MATRHQNLFKKGTAAHSVKYYKEATLTKFLQDLSRLDRRGLKKEECDKVKDSLKEAITLSSTLPKSSYFFKEFHQELESFLEVYEDWNNIGDDANNPISLRRIALSKLMERRRALWEPFRKKIKRLEDKEDKDQQLDLFQELNKTMIDEMHLTFDPLTSEHPDLFPKLKKVIDQFKK